MVLLLSIMGFSDIQITDNYIYTVFHGKKFKEIEQTLKQGEITEYRGRNMYVFDLAGNLVRKNILNHAIYGIDINEDTGKLTYRPQGTCPA